MNKYILPGNPIPLQRARQAYRRVYDPQKEAKLIAGISLKEQHQDKELFEGPLHADIIFYMPLPHHSTKKKLKLITQNYHQYKPDISNLIKFIEDVATGILFKDDCIIASINTKKVYDANPRTELFIINLKEKL